jgi:hypothetical protein
MGKILTTSSTMMCPHGGTVQASSSAQVKAQQSKILRTTDTFNIIGCPFVLGNSPHPCLTVRWITNALMVKSGQAAVLTSDSSGLCLAGDQAPQGSVLIQNTQLNAKAT